MDLVVTGRHIQLSDRFRAHVADRLGKVEQLAPRTLRVDVLVTHEPNPRQAKASERVEVTCHARGPVIRAEACHDDKYAAFEMAMDKADRAAAPGRRQAPGQPGVGARPSLSRRPRAGSAHLRMRRPPPRVSMRVRRRSVTSSERSAIPDRGPREGPRERSHDPQRRAA